MRNGILVIENSEEDYSRYIDIFKEEGYSILPEVENAYSLFSMENFSDICKNVIEQLDNYYHRICLIILDLKLTDKEPLNNTSGKKLIKVIRSYRLNGDEDSIPWGAFIPIIAVSSYGNDKQVFESLFTNDPYSSVDFYFNKNEIFMPEDEKDERWYFLHIINSLRSYFYVKHDTYCRYLSQQHKTDIDHMRNALQSCDNSARVCAMIEPTIIRHNEKLVKMIDLLKKQQNASFSVTLSAIMRDMSDKDVDRFSKEFDIELAQVLSTGHMKTFKSDLELRKSFKAQFENLKKNGSIVDIIEYFTKMAEENGLYECVPGGKLFGKMAGNTLVALAKQLLK